MSTSNFAEAQKAAAVDKMAMKLVKFNKHESDIRLDDWFEIASWCDKEALRARIDTLRAEQGSTSAPPNHSSGNHDTSFQGDSSTQLHRTAVQPVRRNQRISGNSSQTVHHKYQCADCRKKYSTDVNFEKHCFDKHYSNARHLLRLQGLEPTRFYAPPALMETPATALQPPSNGLEAPARIFDHGPQAYTFTPQSIVFNSATHVPRSWNDTSVNALGPLNPASGFTNMIETEPMNFGGVDVAGGDEFGSGAQNSYHYEY